MTTEETQNFDARCIDYFDAYDNIYRAAKYMRSEYPSKSEESLIAAIGDALPRRDDILRCRKEMDKKTEPYTIQSSIYRVDENAGDMPTREKVSTKDVIKVVVWFCIVSISIIVNTVIVPGTADLDYRPECYVWLVVSIGLGIILFGAKKFFSTIWCVIRIYLYIMLFLVVAILAWGLLLVGIHFVLAFARRLLGLLGIGKG